VEEIIADDDAHIRDAAVADLGQHLQPVRRALTTITGPDPEDVASTVTSMTT
jgi:hypothetical protein